jgi:putative transposase
MTTAFTDLRAAQVSVQTACVLTGMSRATHYRRAGATGPMHGPHRPRTPPPQALTEAERARVLDLLASPAYADLAIPQVWARELDAGRYWCSMSTMYRIARAAGQVLERRRQATHPPRVRPELAAHGPSEVWSWDITALKGPVKGVWYRCYVVLDIFSRYVTGWLVAAAEDAVAAKDFLADAVVRNGAEPHTIHADRGGAMVSKPVSELLVDLGILRSHSRPRTSNDNPYSEAQFKTMKYVPDFPERFGSLEDARRFCDGFFLAYNHEHRHSGIGMHTPASVHFGTAEQVHAQRQATLDRAYTTHPRRFTRRPRPPRLPEMAWINQPTDPTTTTGPIDTNRLI